MYYKLINRILLGLLMLVPGLMKLFVMGPSAVTGMFAGMGFPAPMLFAWILIILEVGCGAAILVNYKVRYTAIPPAIIMVVATILTVNWSTGASSGLLHLVAASSYLVLAMTRSSETGMRKR